jgi:hypothetical protein
MPVAVEVVLRLAMVVRVVEKEARWSRLLPPEQKIQPKVDTSIHPSSL